VCQIINANNVIFQVNAKRPLFYREKAAQMYPSILYSVFWGLAKVGIRPPMLVEWQHLELDFLMIAENSCLAGAMLFNLVVFHVRWLFSVSTARLLTAKALSDPLFGAKF
jgi:hypothetical protein